MIKRNVKKKIKRIKIERNSALLMFLFVWFLPLKTGMTSSDQEEVQLPEMVSIRFPLFCLSYVFEKMECVIIAFY